MTTAKPPVLPELAAAQPALPEQLADSASAVVPARAGRAVSDAGVSDTSERSSRDAGCRCCSSSPPDPGDTSPPAPNDGASPPGQPTKLDTPTITRIARGSSTDVATVRRYFAGGKLRPSTRYRIESWLRAEGFGRLVRGGQTEDTSNDKGLNDA